MIMNLDGASPKTSKFNRLGANTMNVKLNLHLHMRKFKINVFYFIYNILF